MYRILDRDGFLRFTNSLSGDPNHKFDFKVELNQWYDIQLEQTRLQEKVSGETDTSNLMSCFTDLLFYLCKRGGGWPLGEHRPLGLLGRDGVRWRRLLSSS